METGKIKLTIESDLRQVQHVGEAVRGLCSQLELVDAKPSSVELAVVEAVNNSIEHNYSSQAGNAVDVSFECDDQNLNIRIKDYGKPLPSAVSSEFTSEVDMPDVNVSKQVLPESGWGLQLVKAVCSDVSYKRVRHCNTLSLSFRLASVPA